jgi:NADH-quinone oxidoreductase subunit E
MKNECKVAQTIVQKYNNNPDSLISILQDIQAEYRYLPEGDLRTVADQLQLPLIQVYGVATFFKAFTLTPCGEHMVTICTGTACHVRGTSLVLDEVERQLNISPGDTTEDLRFTLKTVNCLGACALGPIMVIDGEYHGQMSQGKVKTVLNKYRKSSER